MQAGALIGLIADTDLDWHFKLGKGGSRLTADLNSRRFAKPQSCVQRPPVASHGAVGEQLKAEVLKARLTRTARCDQLADCERLAKQIVSRLQADLPAENVLAAPSEVAEDNITLSRERAGIEARTAQNDLAVKYVDEHVLNVNRRIHAYLAVSNRQVADSLQALCPKIDRPGSPRAPAGGEAHPAADPLRVGASRVDLQHSLDSIARQPPGPGRVDCRFRQIESLPP